MGRPLNTLPKMRRHRARNVAVADYRDPGSGQRRQAVLGTWGSPEAEAAFGRLVRDVLAARREAGRDADRRRFRWDTRAGIGHAVPETCRRLLPGADGRQTSEYRLYVAAVRVLVEVAEGVPARDFGPLKLQSVRDAMVEAGWAREQVNAQVGRVRRIFKWAAANELVPAAVWQALQSVVGLAKGRTSAGESEAVRPADLADVEATIPRLPGPIGDMVRFQLLTGCRPQDVCHLRGDGIDRSGAVWVFRPHQHKGTHRGELRDIYIGPKVQAVLLPWLEEAGSGWVFSPARWMSRKRAERRREADDAEVPESHGPQCFEARRPADTRARRTVHHRELRPRRHADGAQDQRGASGEASAGAAARLDAKPAAAHAADRGAGRIWRGGRPGDRRPQEPEHDGDLCGEVRRAGAEGRAGDRVACQPGRWYLPHMRTTSPHTGLLIAFEGIDGGGQDHTSQAARTVPSGRRGKPSSARRSRRMGRGASRFAGRPRTAACRWPTNCTRL